MLEVFSDRVVISSPGLPPAPITLANLRGTERRSHRGGTTEDLTQHQGSGALAFSFLFRYATVAGRRPALPCSPRCPALASRCEYFFSTMPYKRLRERLQSARRSSAAPRRLHVAGDSNVGDAMDQPQLVAQIGLWSGRRKPDCVMPNSSAFGMIRQQEMCVGRIERGCDTLFHNPRSRS